MTKYIPPGFDSTKIADGLRKAMGFGEPNAADDKAAFYTPVAPEPSADAQDGGGVPFDPGVRRATPPDKKVKPCAIEFFDREGIQISGGGTVRPARIKITILGPDWVEVKDFAYVVTSGDKYVRGIMEPINALGDLDIISVWAISEDER